MNCPRTLYMKTIEETNSVICVILVHCMHIQSVFAQVSHDILRKDHENCIIDVKGAKIQL